MSGILKRIIALTIFCIIIIGVAMAAYFILRPKPHGEPGLELNQRYYINEMRSGLFRYPGLSTDIIRLQPQDHSYAVFENDWKTFRVNFQDADSSFDFVTTKIKRKRGSVTATVQHINHDDNGNIHVYKITTTKEKIVLKSVYIYRVTVASTEYIPPKVEIVKRNNVTAMVFARKTPTYIDESKA